MFITAGPITKLFAWGRGIVEDICVYITAIPIIKLFASGEGDSGGHVLLGPVRNLVL